MYEQVEKPKENKSRAVANSVAQKKSHVKQGFGFVDNRTEAIARTKIPRFTKTNSQVHQFTREDSGIPTAVTEYFTSRGTTYHHFKQNNWDKIATAHEAAHGSQPSTVGAAYTIDAGTGDHLIRLLGDDWQPHDEGRRQEAIAASAAASRERRGAGSSAAVAASPERLTYDDDGKKIREYKSHQKAVGKVGKGGVSRFYYVQGDDTLHGEQN